jgi:hypothetical protein
MVGMVSLLVEVAMLRFVAEEKDPEKTVARIARAEDERECDPNHHRVPST